MSLVVDSIKYGVLLGCAHEFKKPLDNNLALQNPVFSSLSSGCLSALALNTIPRYSSIPSIFQQKPVVRSSAHALVPKGLIAPKAATVLCKTAQGALFVSVYDLAKKKLEKGNDKLPPRLNMTLSAGVGALTGGTLSSLRYPIEIMHRIGPVFQMQAKQSPHLTLKSYAQLFKRLPADLVLTGYRHSYQRPMIAAGIACAGFEGIKELFSKI